MKIRLSPRSALLALFLSLAVIATVQRGVLTKSHATFPIFRQSFVHLTEGRDLYAPYPAEQGTEDRDRFKYSPSAAMFFAPFSLVPLLIGLFLWTALNSLALYAAVDRLFPGRDGNWGLVIVFPALVAAVQSTSSNALIAALMVAGFLAVENRSSTRAAAAISAGTLMKLFPAAGVVFILTHPKRWRMVGIGAVVLAAALAAPLLVTSFDTLMAQYKSWAAILSADEKDLTFARSIMVAVREATGSAIANFAFQSIATILLLAPLVMRRVDWVDPKFRRTFLASLLIYAVIFNHQSENASYIIAAVGLAVWFMARPHTPPRVALLIACMAGLEAVPYAMVWLWLQYELLQVEQVVGWLRTRRPIRVGPYALRFGLAGGFATVAFVTARAVIVPLGAGVSVVQPSLSATATIATAPRPSVDVNRQTTGRRTERVPAVAVARRSGPPFFESPAPRVAAYTDQGLAPTEFQSGLLPQRGLVALPAADPAAVSMLGDNSDVVCTVDTVGTTVPDSWVGRRVGRLDVRAGDIDLPSARLSAIARRLHVSTRSAVVHQELGFRTGQRVDAKQIVESVRRLRESSLFTDVVVEGRQCGEAGPTDLTIHTRDAWTTRAGIRLGGNGSTRFSFVERNLFGSGRSVSLSTEETNTRQALAVRVTDPYLLGLPIRASGMLRAYAEGKGWYWGLSTHDRSPQDDWRVALNSSQVRRFVKDPSAASVTDITRRATALVASHKLASGGDGVWAATAGVEQEQADLDISTSASKRARSTAHRQFVAPLVGLSRRTTSLKSIDWLVPGQRATDLPVGFEGELVTGVGRETHTNATITHWDGWVGATVMPTAGSVLTADIWSNGYRVKDSVTNTSLRASATLVVKAKNGLWTARAAAERLWDPDPDVFALSISDPMFKTLSPTSRLAERALSAHVERAAALYTRDGRWAVEGALFGSWSQRVRTLDVVGDPVREMQAAVVGVGLRHVWADPWQAPLRVDIGRTVMRSGGQPNKWIVSLSVSPWLAGGRARDGLSAPGR